MSIKCLNQAGCSPLGILKFTELSLLKYILPDWSLLFLMPNILLPVAMNLCVLERLLSWNLTLSLTASEGGAFGRQSGNEGGALMNAMKGDSERASLPLPPCEVRVKRQSANIWTAPSTWKLFNKKLVFNIAPGYDFFLVLFCFATKQHCFILIN